MRDGSVLSDDGEPSLCNTLAMMKRAADAAGFHVDSVEVQVALIQAYSAMAQHLALGDLTAAVERAAAELRRSRKGYP